MRPDRSILFSIAHFLDAQHILCIDPNTLVLSSLQPLFSAIDACPTHTIFACAQKHCNALRFDNNLKITNGERKASGEIMRDMQAEVFSQVAHFRLMEDTLFLGSSPVLQTLATLINNFPQTQGIPPDILFNVAVAQLPAVVELDAAYNLQLSDQEATIDYSNGRMQAFFEKQRAHVINFAGVERTKYAAWRGFFARVSHPLVEKGDGDGYTEFLTVLRAWIGQYGMKVMAWSFYGLADDPSSAHVRDPGVFPLFALLHYLIRANGCVRVLETGTARGVSAACLASAVAHRHGAKVVTLDPRTDRYPERKALWASLPERVSQCIEPRGTTSLEGMDAAIAHGERYGAVLLDSIHTEEYVWSEFQRASQLVHPSGLILIHDALLKEHTVGKAVTRIEAAGYNVIRLWAAESGIPEDDHLGLAVIENRKRSETPGIETPEYSSAEAR
jgi:predicted O-methyltransferase YrrM